MTKDTLIKPLGLQSGEVTDVAHFLEALDGEPVPSALLQNTAK